MPETAEATEPAFDVAAFIAENPPTASEEDPEPAEGATEDPALSDEETDAEAAALAAVDADDAKEAAEEAAETEASEDPEETPAEEKGVDVEALKSALKAKNPEQFLAALGDDAEHVLGAKAHRALRIAAKDVAGARTNLLKAADDLRGKFGDPAAIRAAASKGDADAVVEGIEKFFGASWLDLNKFVNDSFAGKEARLEQKALRAKEESDAKTAKEQTEAAAASEKQTAAVATLKTTITGVVKKTQPALAEFPGLTDLVFDKLKSGYSNGINTPAKAIAAVLLDLRAQHAALAKAFAAPVKKGSKTAPPPRETAKRGREMTEAEFIADFLRNNKP